MEIGSLIIMSLIGILAISAVAFSLMYRRVVPTNMVHIVQSTKTTTSYGRGKPAGNTYYEWPSSWPRLGVTVIQFPESIFQVSLDNYEAYDTARLPFVVDVAAFFRVENSETAAQRASSFDGLKGQLEAVLQGAVRRILATNSLEEIMQERSSFGQQFTDEVRQQIMEWGVQPVKTIEFMDIRDSVKGNVIANIMEKEKSRIEKESRVTVAENMREAELKEIDAKRTVEVQKQDALQQVGLKTAEKEKLVGIAEEESKQEILTQSKITAEKNMEVERVQEVKKAEIQKDVSIIASEQNKSVSITNAEAAKLVLIANAEAAKESSNLKADADLYAATQSAEGIKLEGVAKADAEKAMQMAPVEAQIQLADKIGQNDGYQKYLITVEQIKSAQIVGVEMAKSMQNAKMQVIANGGDVQSGITGLADMFSAKGGMNMTSMLSALSTTEQGQKMLDKFFGGTSAIANAEEIATQTN